MDIKKYTAAKQVTVLILKKFEGGRGKGIALAAREWICEED